MNFGGWRRRKMGNGSVGVETRRKKCVFIPKTRLCAHGLSEHFKMAKREVTLRSTCEDCMRAGRQEEEEKEMRTKKKQARLNGKGGGFAGACLLCERGWKFLSYFQQSFRPSFSSLLVLYSENWKDQRLGEVDTIPGKAVLLSLSLSLSLLHIHSRWSSAKDWGGASTFPDSFRQKCNWQRNLCNDTVSPLTACYKFMFRSQVSRKYEKGYYTNYSWKQSVSARKNVNRTFYKYKKQKENQQCCVVQKIINK